MNENEQIVSLAVTLSRGESLSGQSCPYCNGGRSADRSLSISLTSGGAILYMCHRASCKAKGIIGPRGTGGIHSSGGGVSFNPKRYSGKVGPLFLEDFEFLDGRYGLSVDLITSSGWMRMVDFPNTELPPPLIMPIISPNGMFRGVCTRRTDAEGKKQVRVFKEVDEPLLCWYRHVNPKVIVVEDQISALKASNYCTAVALMGTNLDYNKVEEIAEVANGAPVWIALDRDATAKAFDYFKLYRAWIPELSLLMLTKDIKDMRDDEILNLKGPFDYERRTQSVMA